MTEQFKPNQEPAPPSDEELINIEIELALQDRRNISDSAARVIASQWHGGQASELYSFSSTGCIGEGLLDEIQRESRNAAEQQLYDYLVHLIALEQYVEAREDTDAVPGWSQLWLGKGQDEDTESCPACAAHISEPCAPDCPISRSEEEE